MKKYLIIIGIIIQFFSLFSLAQTSNISIENTTVCDPGSINIPVQIGNFNDVGAMTLFIEFDTLGLDCISIININDQFPGLLYNIVYEPQAQIGISWANVNGVNIVSDKLFDIEVAYQQGTSSLRFNDACEIVTTELISVPIEYTNGTISPSIEITQQPVNISINEPDEASFSVLNNGGEDYQWERSVDEGITFSELEDSDIFAGVNTHELIINQTSLTFDQNIFRCRVSNSDCSLISQRAILSIIPKIYTQAVNFETGWNSFSVYLSPSDLNIETLFAPIMSSVILISDGSGVYDPKTGLNTIGDFNPNNAYVIKSKTNTPFDISGIYNPSTTLIIPKGYSYLPVLSPCDVLLETVFGSQMTKVEIISELPGLNMVWPSKNIHTIDVLESGKAYLIKASDELEILFPNCP